MADRLVVEVASVAPNGGVHLPKRVREVLGIPAAGKIVIFANREKRSATVVAENACRAPANLDGPLVLAQ